MKKIISFTSALVVISLLLLPSCGTEEQEHLTLGQTSEKEAFMTECVEKAWMNQVVDAEDYCSCMLDKVVKEYPTPEDAAKITYGVDDERSPSLLID